MVIEISSEDNFLKDKRKRKSPGCPGERGGRAYVKDWRLEIGGDLRYVEALSLLLFISSCISNEKTAQAVRGSHYPT